MLKGLFPVVTTDTCGNVLMLAYANEEALKKTMESGKAWYWSRSRDKLWMKGESSGNVQTIKAVYADCDKDAFLYVVEQKGDACHLGTYSCFTDRLFGEDGFSLCDVYKTIEERKETKPGGSYVAGIIGDEKRLTEKIEEESNELVEAFTRSGKEEVVWEAADVIFHTFLLLVNRGIKWQELVSEFGRRRTER